MVLISSCRGFPPSPALVGWMMSFLKLIEWWIDRLVVFPGPSLNVVAKRTREASVGGATFEMSCTVATENLGEAGYSVLIQSQDSLESNVRTIMTLSPDNVLQHGGATDPNRRYIPGFIHSHSNFSMMHWSLHVILKYMHLSLSVYSETVWFWRSLVRQSFAFV